MKWTNTKTVPKQLQHKEVWKGEQSQRIRDEGLVFCVRLLFRICFIIRGDAVF